MAILNLQIAIKDSRVADIKLCLERAISMPMMADPENPDRQIPMFDNTKVLVEWWLEERLRRVTEQGHKLLQIDATPFDSDFLE